IRFLLVTFTASPGDGAYTLEYGSRIEPPKFAGLNVIQTDALVSIDFSLGLGLRIRRDSGDVISEVYDSIRDSGGGRLRRPVRAYFVDQNGARYESGTHERRVV